MKILVLCKAVLVAGILLSPVRAADYLSAEIAKGNSWRYLKADAPNVYGMIDTTIFDYTIDSVWGDTIDTLFFIVSERDTVFWTNSPSLPDSGFAASCKLLCKKADGVTVCDSFIVRRLFTDVVMVEIDSAVMVNGVIYSSNFSRQLDVEFNSMQVEGVETGSYWSGIGTHMGSSVDTACFIDKVGALRIRSNHISLNSQGNDNRTMILLRYNGSDVSFSYDAVGVRKSVAGLKVAPMMIRCTVGRHHLEPGFNLLGQMNRSAVGGFGMRVLKVPVR